jgi:hypothetical protein
MRAQIRKGGLNAGGCRRRDWHPRKAKQLATSARSCISTCPRSIDIIIIHNLAVIFIRHVLALQVIFIPIAVSPGVGGGSG